MKIENIEGGHIGEERDPIRRGLPFVIMDESYDFIWKRINCDFGGQGKELFPQNWLHNLFRDFFYDREKKLGIVYVWKFPWKLISRNFSKKMLNFSIMY